MRPFPLSLRARLFAVSTTALLAVTAALTLTQARLVETALVRQIEERAETERPFFNAAFAAPLAQRDYATVRAVIRESVHQRGLAHLVLTDNEGNLIAAEGWDVARDGLPLVTFGPSRGPGGTRRIAFYTPIQYDELNLGHLYYGLSWEPLAAIRSQLLLVGALLAVGFLAAVILLTDRLHARLVRPLMQLRRSSEALARGEESADLPPPGDDDVGALSRSFRAMSDEVRRRIGALTQSEAEQRRLLVEAHQRERQLEEAKSEVEAAAAAKSRFLAMMGHEIRTPLNAVIGMTGLLRGMPLDPTQRRYVAVIEESSEHLLGIINGILDFSRLDTNQIELTEGPFQPRRIVASVVEVARGQAGAAGLAITSTIAPDVPETVVGDSGRVRQILLNLLGNAVKFTTDGAVGMTLERIAGKADQVRLRWSVRDSGPGIPREMRARLFQPFEQLSPTVAGRRGGAGLGLAISKRLVERMDGIIGFTSDPGRGSTFWVELPFQPASAPLAAASAARTEPVLVRRRILVVEDTPSGQMLVEAMLERLGHDAVVVGDGAAAVALATRTPFDLVLMDVLMPVMDGYEATRRIRALDGPAGRVPIVALTAFADPAERERTRAAGMDAHLSKPVRLEDLADAIDRYARSEPA